MTRRLYECPGCGAELLSAARACPNCGESLHAVLPSKYADEPIPNPEADDVVRPAPHILTDAGVMREVRAVLLAEQAKREATNDAS